MTNTPRNAWRLVAGLIVLTLALVMAAVDPAAGDGSRPTYPPLTCTHVEQAQCRAILTNSWDGRQVIHRLDPVAVCDTRRVSVLADRVDRKNRTIRTLRDKVARLRERLAR